MRILYLTCIYPQPGQPTKGPFTFQLCKALAAEHDVKIVSPRSWIDGLRGMGKNGHSTAAGPSKLDGVDVEYPYYFYPPKLFRRTYGWFMWISLRKRLKRCLAEFKPDCIVSYWLHPDGEVAVRAAEMSEIPAVVMVGGSDALLLTRRSGRRRCIVKVLREADAVVAVSQSLKGKVIELGADPRKVHVVYRGVDPCLFSPGDQLEARQLLGIAKQVPSLVWVGRMVPVKGLDILLLACKSLRERGLAFHLYLIGDGSQRASLETQARELDLASHLTFVGSVSQEQLPNWYRAANITVLPSHSEGIPNVLRESLACGTPFVASRVGGIPEIATQSNHRLVPPGDPAALAEALSLALLEKGSGAVACPSSWRESARALVRVLEPLVASRASSSIHGQLSTSIPTAGAAPARWRQWIRRGMAQAVPRRLLLVSGPAKAKSVCLTFDDGPHPEHTPRLLDVLREHSIQATFFLVGQRAEQYPDLVRRMASEGHVVGHHSYFHGEPSETSTKELIEEIHLTRQLFMKLLGKPPILFRPPKGKLTAFQLWRLWLMTESIVLWNVDPKDYACQSPDELRKWFQKRPLQGGDVLLMHDNHPHAAEVLPELVAATRESGLSFTTPEKWTV